MHDLDRIQAEWYSGEFDETTPVDGLADQEEAELAAELLAVRDEDELEQFVGKLISRAARAAGNVLRSDVGRAVGGIVKSSVAGAARNALPKLGGVLGGAVGGRFGFSETGARIGERLGSAVLSRLGLGELEGAFIDDQTEFEVARQIVRFAGETAQRAAAAPAGENGQQAAYTAAAAAARRAAQAIPVAMPSSARRRSGRWVRRGNTIVLTQV